MWNKYSKKVKHQVVDLYRGSQTWKYMLEAREMFDQEILREPKCGHSNVWYDNCTQLDVLHYIMPINILVNDHLEEVRKLLRNGRWNKEVLIIAIDEEVYAHVCDMGYILE